MFFSEKMLIIASANGLVCLQPENKALRNTDQLMNQAQKAG